ncbi:MAG: D-alanyl-D-alanine carboxypeptidase/D-alanyl-D-alanine-endopeptidase [Bacteroidota bacterium]
MVYQLRSYFLCLLLFFMPLSGQAKPKPATTVAAAIQAAKNNKLLQPASIGFYAMNLTTGKVIGDVNATKSMIPASTLKLLTTAAALETLGKDFQFKTTIQYDGEIDKHGTLHGNIYIKGGGDPALGSQEFPDYYYQPHFITTWVQAIQAQGIKKITGAVIGDAQIYAESMIPATWVVEDLGEYYGTGASGLSIFDNLYKITLQAGSEGEAASLIDVTPSIPEEIQIISYATGASIDREKTCIKGFPYQPLRIIQGKIPYGEPVTLKASSPDPACWAAYTLHRALQEQAIQVTQSPTTIRRAELTSAARNDLLTTLSPPLWQIIKIINHKSLNGYTEHLLKHLGLVTAGAGDTSSGTQALKQFWESRGIDITGMLLFDGSGLSRYNALTPKQLVEALAYMKHSANFSFFYEALPIVGETGNVAGFCQQPSLKGHLRAKSGYLANARGFAGYGANQKGDEIAFALLVNHYDGSSEEARKALEEILEVVVSQK